jgi:Mg/Co/Ni transporter MgtE
LDGEGEKADEPTAGSVMRTDAPTCRIDETVGDARSRCTDLMCCVVVNEAGTVAGILRDDRLHGDPSRRVDEVMRPGPSTFRANVPVEEMARYLTKHDLANAPITVPDGRFLGLLVRDDVTA